MTKTESHFNLKITSIEDLMLWIDTIQPMCRNLTNLIDLRASTELKNRAKFMSSMRRIHEIEDANSPDIISSEDMMVLVHAEVKATNDLLGDLAAIDQDLEDIKNKIAIHQRNISKRLGEFFGSVAKSQIEESGRLTGAKSHENFNRIIARNWRAAQIEDHLAKNFSPTSNRNEPNQTTYQPGF